MEEELIADINIEIVDTEDLEKSNDDLFNIMGSRYVLQRVDKYV